MGKILVIQPHRMLQQAIALSLFPEHEVRIVEAVPEPSAVEDYDAVIFDAVSLRETGGLSPQLVRTVQNWKVPTIWIDTGEPSQAPKRENLVLLRGPMAREILQSSLAKCLGISTGARRNGTPPVADQHSRAAAEVAANDASDVVSTVTRNAQFIELVDVVEEGPGRKGRRK